MSLGQDCGYGRITVSVVIKVSVRVRETIILNITQNPNTNP